VSSVLRCWRNITLSHAHVYFVYSVSIRVVWKSERNTSRTPAMPCVPSPTIDIRREFIYWKERGVT
jgi:hypothetical protein